MCDPRGMAFVLVAFVLFGYKVVVLVLMSVLEYVFVFLG